ncbi:GNAT family N-acetyltransferase [Sinomicrobium weinanense]|uniref:GNAT family N-acetyltransferase n=1 Tax=Sinomicrobium weinanense TaxID=2842200 RepID=UPI001FFDC23A|nr:GNAT family N-acetyltransferase [Sinomicrobium weinanense]
MKEYGYEYLPQTSEVDLENIDKVYNANNGIFLIGVNEENEIIATGGLLKVTGSCFKLRKIYVAKAYRGNGFGKQIVNKLLQIARAKKAGQIVIETSSKMTTALSMYRSLGFYVVDGKITSPRCNIKMKYLDIDHREDLNTKL